MTAFRLQPFGTSIFATMSALAKEKGAINLSQGFPDFEGPPEIVQAACKALGSGHNQYARSRGEEPLVRAIAEHQKSCYGLSYDPMSQVCVFSGATEAIAASLLGLLNPGDEVILFEPFYDSYPACLALAGAVPRICTLRFPDFSVPMQELEALFSERTRLLILNNPQNPTGKVFSREELLAISALCQKHNVLVLSDEVYEHLTYDGLRHIPMATLPGMHERTLTISSAGKTYSFTGWKVGWVSGPKEMVDAAHAAHQFMTFATATPLQHAVAHGLSHFQAPFFTQLASEYQERRDFLVGALEAVGFEVAVPKGTYFILADFTPLFQGTDQDFALFLTGQYRVAAIPPSVFYQACPQEGQHLVRFAFCKRWETLHEAARRLQQLGSLRK